MSPSPALYGIVDLGTWTIRFSINSVQPHHARTLPCVFQDRAPIRLYKGPDVLITREEIDETLVSLKRFRSICKDYGVMSKNIQIAANPHEAPNIEDLIEAIHKELHIEVLRLSKEGEHWANAYGVASSTYHAQGLYIELRPTHVNVYYLSLCQSDGADEVLIGPVKVYYTPESSSFRVQNNSDLVDGTENESYTPYNADELDGFEAQLKHTCNTLLEKASHKNIWSSQVFLSGSGFNGLHTLLSTAATGFGVVTTGLVLKPQSLTAVHSTTRLARVVHAVGASLPNSTTKIVFVHHNLRNGLLFQALPPSIRYQDPLIVATQPYALPGAPKLALQLQRTLPKELCPPFIRERLAVAVANAAYIHSSYNAEVQSFSALVVAETGLLAGTHGLTHEEKVLLGLALCQRWGLNLDTCAFEIRKQMIASLSDPQLAWWALYSGLVLHLLGAAYPGAHVREGALDFATEVSPDKKKFKLYVRQFRNSIYSENVIMRNRISSIQKLMSELGDRVEMVVELVEN